MTNEIVCVLPFYLENGIITKLGTRKDGNIISCELNVDEDTSLLLRAMILLKEEVGAEINDSTSWIYLDSLKTDSKSNFYVFGVKIPTDMEHDSKNFSMIDAKEAVNFRDSILIASFFKLFMNIYKKEINDKHD